MPYCWPWRRQRYWMDQKQGRRMGNEREGRRMRARIELKCGRQAECGKRMTHRMPLCGPAPCTYSQLSISLSTAVGEFH